MNIASTTSIVNTPSFRSDTGPGDSFVAIQKDCGDNSTSADPEVSDVATNSDTVQEILSGLLPPEVRGILDRWYTERGVHRPLPCATPGHIVKPIFTSDAAMFARYEHEDGE